MADRRDAVMIEPASEDGRGLFDGCETVEDQPHVVESRLPEEGVAGRSLAKARDLGIRMGRLDDDEAMGGVEIDERAIAILEGI